MNLITIKTFDNAISARLLKGKLESEGIACYIFDEEMVSLNPLYSGAIGGIRLEVNDYDLKFAQEIIDSIDNAPIIANDGSVLTCPKCKSTRINNNYKSMKDAKNIIAFLISFMIMVFPFYSKSVNKCKDCRTEFPKV
jgi:hypothetical protein